MNECITTWGTMECPECEDLGDLRKTRPLIDIIYCSGVKTKIYPSCPTCYGTGEVPRPLPPGFCVYYHEEIPGYAEAIYRLLGPSGETVAERRFEDNKWKMWVELDDDWDEYYWPAIRQFFDTPPDEALAKELTGNLCQE